MLVNLINEFETVNCSQKKSVCEQPKKEKERAPN